MPGGTHPRLMCSLAALLIAVTLTACGSSSSSTTTTSSTETAAATNTQTSTETTTSTAAAISVPGCRNVPAPPSRAGEEVPKPTTTLDPAHRYTVTLDTNCGPIVIGLAVREAPKIASAFAYLTQKGYYDNLTFHRIVQNFVIQGGDPKGNGTGGPSWGVVEAPPANLQYTRGTVAMAKSGSAPSGAAGSQFFIVTGANVHLPPVYALVGHVISGQNNVEAIGKVPTGTPAEGGESSRPQIPIVIEKATLAVH